MTTMTGRAIRDPLAEGPTRTERLDWAFVQTLSPREKSVLIAIAYNDGTKPSVVTQLTGMRIGAVAESINQLFDEGYLAMTPDGIVVRPAVDAA